MAIGISPTVDFAFKLMLGSPEHSNVTIHFLNAILGDQPKIKQVKILNPILGQETDEDKISVLDILATDEHERMLNIEMQTSLQKGISQRLTYYASSLYVNQLVAGAPYTALRPAISICVLTKSIFPQVADLHLDFRLRGSGGLILTDDIQIHLLELSKLRVTEQNVYHATPIERWAYFLRNAEKLTPNDIGRIFPDREISEAAGVLEMISQTPEQQRLYDARLKFQRDAAASLEWARDEGRREGLMEGLNEGRNEGRNEGLRKGELTGRIVTLQEVLSVTRPTRDELSEYDEVQLIELADQLRDLLRSRNQ